MKRLNVSLALCVCVSGAIVVSQVPSVAREAIERDVSPQLLKTAAKTKTEKKTAYQLIPNEYVVLLKRGVVKDGSNPGAKGREISAVAGELSQLFGGRVRRTMKHAVQGFTVNMPAQEAERLKSHPLVENVFQDFSVPALSANWPINCSRIITGNSWEGFKGQGIGQPASPQAISCASFSWCFDNWGLDRIDQRQLPRNSSYAYGTNDGRGVHIYMVDTGINFEHQEFKDQFGGSRIGNGRNFAVFWPWLGNVPDPADTDDCSYHGSHAAAVAAGLRYGVAKGATLHPVRIAGDQDKSDSNSPCNARARVSWMIEGIDWIAANHIKPAVVNISVNIETSGHDTGETAAGHQIGLSAMERGIQNLISVYGITVVNSAGNSNIDTSAYSPSRMRDVMVVAGSDMDDYPLGRCKPYQSSCFGTNWGDLVDVFAPADFIAGASWIGSDSVCQNGGTSWAAPHVTGVIARYLQLNPLATPAQVQQFIINSSTPGVIRGQLGWGTPNRMLYAQP